jgi:hypothetical protein
VTTQLAARPAPPAPVTVPPPAGPLERFRRRRRAAEQDRRSARLAELHDITGIVSEAAALVETGWVRHAWFAYADEHGGRRIATTLTAHRASSRPVVGACLVGAVVHAGGGLGAVETQPVQRSLDLLWHALERDPDEPVRWCPAPSVRAAHLRDLVRWNDAPGRTQAETARLLHTAGAVAEREMARLR